MPANTEMLLYQTQCKGREKHGWYADCTHNLLDSNNCQLAKAVKMRVSALHPTGVCESMQRHDHRPTAWNQKSASKPSQM